MSKKVMNAVLKLARPALDADGWVQRKEETFTCEINDETMGVLYLPRADNYGFSNWTSVAPSVGVRNLSIEELVGELEGKGPGYGRSGLLPTVSNPLGYLMPQNTYMSWEFGLPATDYAQTVQDMLTAIDTYGRRFIDRYASFAAVAEAVLNPKGVYIPPPYIDTKRSVVHYLLGDFARAREALREVRNAEFTAALIQRIEQAEHA